MSQALYRKYRSQKFNELIGQEVIVSILTQAISEQKISHAYIFAGPRGTGKTSAARIFAKAINCLSLKEGEPCNECQNCKAINENSFMDMIEIDAASNRGIDEIRQLKEKVNFLPVVGKYKTYIIDEVHMLTTEAFNALLKTLEEPPERVIFILATTEVHKIPITILSRTQRFDFKLATKKDLETKISRILKEEGINFEPGAIELVVEAGNGSFRDSETILDKVLTSVGFKKDKVINEVDVEKILGFTNRKVIKDLISGIIEGDFARCIDLVNNIFNSGANFNQLLKQLIENLQIIIENKIAINDNFLPEIKLAELLSELQAKIAFILNPKLDLEVIISKFAKNTSIETQLESEPRLEPKPEVTISQKVVKAEATVVPEKPEKETNPRKVQQAISFDIIKSKWAEILEQIVPYNSHLRALFEKTELVSFENGVIKLNTPFEFHKKKLDDPKSIKIFQEVMYNIFGVEVKLQVIFSKTVSQTNPKNDDFGSNAKIVEELFN